VNSVRISTGTSARQALLAGVAEMAKVVGVTYGPRGRTVMLDRVGGILSTKDGAAVAWEVEPENPVRRLGTRALQEACSKVNKVAGDGTTTTALLVHAILVECHKWVEAGANAALLAQDLQRVAEDLDGADLWDILVPEPVEHDGLLYDIAMNASHGDEEVSKAIVEALDMVGSQGMVSIEEGKGRGIELVPKNGLELKRGLESTHFLSEDGISRKFDVALVALVDGELTKLADVQNIIEQATQFPHPLVIVSRGCFGEALQVLCMNDKKLECNSGKFQCAVVRVPGHLDQQKAHLADLAALTGAKILDPAAGDDLASCNSEVLGSTQSCTLKLDTSTFVAFEDKYEGIERRVAELQVQKERATYSYDIEMLNERIAKLTNGFCLMRVGAATEVEIRERRGRIEDALNAVRCAVDGGVVPGGGISYLALSNFLSGSIGFSKDMASYGRQDLITAGLGDRVLVEALQVPLRTLARNAGYEPSVIVARVLKASCERGRGPCPSWKTGWDALTDEVRDFRQSPVIADPLEVVKAVVLTAISTASTLLTADVAITKAP